MSVRQLVAQLASGGPLPAESDATVPQIEAVQSVLEGIAAPLSDEEAQLMLGIFGDDTCFGLAWTVLHLIESAPSALTAEYATNADNYWVKRLETRRRGQPR